VHVAALAGLPPAVVARARELLHELERQAAGIASGPESPISNAAQPWLLTAAPDALVAELAALEPDALTPLEALERLYELRHSARQRLAVEG
jgi:DNA mismatch repair protein MutS